MRTGQESGRACRAGGGSGSVSGRFRGRRIRWWMALSLVLWPALSFAGSLTILYSANLDGELEPCGCTEEGNLGGIQRRATLIDRLRAEEEPLIVISGGGLLISDTPHDRLISEYILRGIAALDYDAIAVQWRDLAYGMDFLKTVNLPWVASNWQAEKVAGVARERELRRGPYRLMFFAWMDPGAAPHNAMPGGGAPVSDDRQALHDRLAAAKKAGALTVLATTLTADEVAEQFPLQWLDIVLTRSAYEVYGEPHRRGSTLFLEPGSRGMRLGKLEVEIRDNRIAAYRHEVISLPASVPDSPRMAAWYKEYNEKVKAAYEQTVRLRQAREQGQSPYIGAEACAACHPSQTEIWQASDHAEAFDALLNVNKAFDPDCIGCHTVGFDQEGGFIESQITGHLENVQCESCHGAARAHVVSQGREPPAYADWPPRRMCAQCHVPKHSPSFEFSSYWKKIRHGSGE